MSTRKEVYEAIDTERNYQDSLRKDGTFEVHDLTSGQEILMIEEYALRARQAWTNNSGVNPTDALDVIRKIAALCVRCMENNGVVQRGEGNPYPNIVKSYSPI